MGRRLNLKRSGFRQWRSDSGRTLFQHVEASTRVMRMATKTRHQLFTQQRHANVSFALAGTTHTLPTTRAPRKILDLPLHLHPTLWEAGTRQLLAATGSSHGQGEKRRPGRACARPVPSLMLSTDMATLSEVALQQEKATQPHTETPSGSQVRSVRCTDHRSLRHQIAPEQGRSLCGSS